VTGGQRGLGHRPWSNDSVIPFHSYFALLLEEAYESGIIQRWKGPIVIINKDNIEKHINQNLLKGGASKERYI
jgi:hypothetical protein